VAPPIRRVAPGTYAVELPAGVAELLEHLCSQVEALLSTDSPLLARLFPPPYGDDTERNEGYAALAVPELIEHRLAALETVRRTLRADRLTEDELMAWLRSLNDMRLVLGTLLGVSDDDGPPRVPPEQEETLEVYEFLGYLLEVTVAALGE
jgi:hypothetical protein